MSIAVLHTFIGGSAPCWYLLEHWKDADRQKAIQRARWYALDHGGYVCVKDAEGKVIYGTDPAELDRTIESGGNRHFTYESAGVVV